MVTIRGRGYASAMNTDEAGIAGAEHDIGGIGAAAREAAEALAGLGRAASGGMASTVLIIQPRGGEPSMFTGDFVIGQAGDLAVADEHASGKHALARLADGVWYLEDLASTSGTRLNGQRVHGPVPLAKGDWIGVGRTSLVVVPA
jgi:hypothetical protein